jgi:dihydroorotase
VDAGGLVCAPGLVDLHTHLREPGREDAETIATGTAAAAAGGYTAVSPMANTDPVCDHAGVVEQVLRLARDAGRCDVFPVGAITRGLGGDQLAEIGAMAAVGVRCFSDDGLPVRSARVLRRALEYGRTWDAIIANHAEEADLTEGAQMNEGELSSLLGLTGWPREAEEIMVARDLMLAEGARARLHVPHVSTRGTVELVRAAKARGVRVTAEATPHHFVLTEQAAIGYDPVFKVNPPLRSADDVLAVRQGLADGTLDAIATDHAPHAPEQKEQEWVQAPCGMLGLETALALTLTELVDEVLSLSQAVALLSTRPARSRDIPGHGGPVVPGAPANLVLFDPAALWTVDERALHSRSRNTPFAGRKLRGRVVHTLLRGRFTVRDGELAG